VESIIINSPIPVNLSPRYGYPAVL